MKTVLAWHFCGDKLRDGRPIPRQGTQEGPQQGTQEGTQEGTQHGTQQGPHRINGSPAKH